MGRQDKPYRVYRGGRTKGKVPLQTRPDRDGRRDGRDGRRGADGAQPARPRRRTKWTKKTAFGFLFVLLLTTLIVWAVMSYLALSRGVEAANERLHPRTAAALTPQEGLLLSRATTILLLGTDHANTDSRVGLRHADSIMLLRTDPRRHRLAYLSIPRDLRVPIPGYGDEKINSAYQIGGAALTVRTVENFTGLKVNHVIVVDFGSFRELIDALGGVTVDVPRKVVSNAFDCPFTVARCASWEGWRFRKGPQRMNGQRALVYSRIRKNRLDASESDVTRGARQQAVLRATISKLTSPGTLARLPFRGEQVMRPLTTDLSTRELVQLGWVKFRAPDSRALQCRLGGTGASLGGESVIISTEENIAVIHMVLGDSAPQPPAPGSGPYGPGCAVGGRVLR